MRRPIACLAGCVAVFGSAAAPAEERATIRVTGSAIQHFDPDTVRVRFRVFAHGMTATSAMAKLDAGRGLLEKRLAGLEAPRPVHRFGPALARRAGPAGARQMQVMIQNMMQGGAGNQEDDDLIRLAFTVTLEWKLTGDSFGAHYRRLDAIREQLEEIGVAARRDDRKKSDAEKESQEEAVSEDEEPPAPPAKLRFADGPRFYFLRHLSEEEAGAGARLAFADAKRRAARLAAAGGGRLGPLVSLSDNTVSPVVDMGEYTRAMTMMFGTEPPRFEEDAHRPPGELSSDALQPIVHETKMTAVFVLEGGS